MNVSALALAANEMRRMAKQTKDATAEQARALRGTLSTTNALTTAAENVANAMSEQAIGTAQLGVKVDGEGELLWDLEAGHVHGFEMKADFELTVEFDVDASADDGDHSAEVSAEMLGGATWKVGLGGS